MNSCKAIRKIMSTVVELALLTTPIWAAPLNPATLKLIPTDAHQIISVDYATARKSASAMALKGQVLPDGLRAFESALKGIGVNPDKDLESLTFISLGNEKDGFTMVALATGSFSSKVILTSEPLQKLKPGRYNDCLVYPMLSQAQPSSNPSVLDLRVQGMKMTFLSDNSLLFGDDSALKAALDTRAGHTSDFAVNRELMEVIRPIQIDPVWSVLDQQGTLNMLLFTMGKDPGLRPAYERIKDKVLSSHYSMSFDNGLRMELHMVTSDSHTSALVSSLLQAGIIYQGLTATPERRAGLENVSASTDLSDMQVRFAANQDLFQDLLRTKFFAPISGEDKKPSSVGPTTVLAKQSH